MTMEELFELTQDITKIDVKNIKIADQKIRNNDGNAAASNKSCDA